MRKIVLLFCIFLIYALFVKFCPFVTQTDITVIKFLQEKFNDIPSFIPVLMDSKLYAALITLSVISGIVFFFRKYLLIDMVLFASSPLVAYLLNIVIKNVVQRPRPPIELQMAVQPSTYSFVSSHTLVTTTLFGLFAFYINEYCQNKILKYSGIFLCILWILFMGLSRILLGVHNPTDVFGGYFLGIILIFGYVKLINLIGGKC